MSLVSWLALASTLLPFLPLRIDNIVLILLVCNLLIAEADLGKLSLLIDHMLSWLTYLVLCTLLPRSFCSLAEV